MCPLTSMHNHLNLKQAQKPSQTVLSSHDHKHSIIGGADIHAPTHHLTVNAASCYLILLSFFSFSLKKFFFFFFLFHFANTRRVALWKRIGLLSHTTSRFSQSSWHFSRRLRENSVAPGTVHASPVSLAASSLQAL